MAYISKRTVYVLEPRWTDSEFDMSKNLLYMLIRQKLLRRHIQKITIEVEELTRIDYIIQPGRWINRLYDNGMMRRGTL